LIGIWWFVRASLRSVRSYRDAIESKGAGDLSPVHTEQLPPEIEPIAVGVNRLLERLRRALEAERSFTANSAHELRTPLATALAQVQRLKREAPAGPLREKTREIEKSLRGLSKLSEKIMQLAKAEGGSLLSEKPQDLVPVLALVVEELRYHAEVPIDLDSPEHRQVLSMIDPDAFAILARNLIDNALKHGTSERPVEISLSDGVLRVANAGPVVPSEMLERIRHPFVRSSPDTPGSGLGLAIAEEIASGVGATLLLHSPATGRSDGFEAIFCFPATSLKPKGSVI
jgi:two-component system OmpR family sensor kinase